MRLDSQHVLELAHSKDSDAIATGTRRSIQAEQQKLVLASSPNYANYVKYLLDNPQLEPDRRHYVIKSDDHIVGYIDLRKTNSEPHLNHIWISSSRQGSGVGTAALRVALSRCAKDSVLDLNVVAGNPAQRWYEKLGMTINHVDRWYVRTAIPAPPLIPRSAHMVSASLSAYGIATAFHPTVSQHVDLLEPNTVKISLDSESQRDHVNMADRIAATYPSFTQIAEHVRECGSRSTASRGAHLASAHMSAELRIVVAALEARATKAHNRNET